MSGKILIYGGSGALGAASARLLKTMGYDLHLVGSKADKLRTIAEEMEAGMSVLDLRDPISFRQATEDAGKDLAGLIYAVGTINLKSLRRLDEADFLDDFRVNALGAALAIKEALSPLKNIPDPRWSFIPAWRWARAWPCTPP